MVARAAGDDAAFGEGPDGDEIVLAACEDIFAVGRPADTAEGAIVGGVEIRELFLEIVDYAQRAVLGNDSEMTAVRRKAEVRDAVVGDLP